jgi:hypothetical protein
LVLGLATAAGILAAQFSTTLGWVAAGVTLIALADKLWAQRQHIQAYGKGAIGEQRTAKALEKTEGYLILHDRKIPGSRANIDHIAVGAGGVFVIETKNYKGKLTIQAKKLRIAGRDCTRFVEQAWRESAAVQSLLAEEVSKLGFDVVPILCVHGAELPWSKVQLEGVRIVGSRGLKKLLSEASRRLSDEDIIRIHGLLEGSLKPA